MPQELPNITKNPSVKGEAMTRRLFLRIIALLGLGVLVDGVSGGKLHQLLTPNTTADLEGLQNDSQDVSEAMEHAAHKIAQEMEPQLEGLNEREKALKIVDYLGTFLFAWGIKDLMPDVFESGYGHINQAHYGCLLALTKLKHSLSNEEGRHHLTNEWISSAKAFGIIGGTIAIAEGLNMDIEEAYEQVSGNAPSQADKVAMMTMMASVLSPVATTVGSAGIIRKMSNTLADGNEAVMAVCTSHVSNLSGYLLFGDPPFIAMCEKYGFQKAVMWQLKNMWPLALYSLISSTFKINLSLNNQGGVEDPIAEAFKQTKDGILKNIPFLVRIIFNSLRNMTRYFSLKDQDIDGIKVSIGEVLTQKLGNMFKLPFSPEFDHHGHEIHEGMTTDVPKVREGDALIYRILQQLSGGDTKNNSSQHDDLDRAIRNESWEEVRRLAKELNIENIEVFIGALKDLHDDAHVDSNIHSSNIPSGIANYLNPFKIYDRATNHPRIQTALGHNLADVANVFPFQAGCVPFLTPVFKDVLAGMESMGLSEVMKESITFFMIMLFSMVADNYVGCKIGLELLPERPQVALIAAIQGGSHSAIGNMANIAQFDLNTFSLKGSLKQFGWHLDNAALGFAHSTALGFLQKAGIFSAPESIKVTPVKESEPNKTVEVSRRAIFTGLRRA